MKVVSLSAQHIGRLYPSGNITGTHFCCRLSGPHGHSAAAIFMKMKNSNDTFFNYVYSRITASYKLYNIPCQPHRLSAYTAMDFSYSVHD